MNMSTRNRSADVGSAVEQPLRVGRLLVVADAQTAAQVSRVAEAVEYARRGESGRWEIDLAASAKQAMRHLSASAAADDGYDLMVLALDTDGVEQLADRATGRLVLLHAAGLDVPLALEGGSGAPGDPVVLNNPLTGPDLAKLTLVLDVLASRRLDVAPGPERASRARSLDALPDLGRFRRRLKQSLARSRRDASARFAVLLLDLDRFNVINQTVGHEAGDELLTAVADRLEACLACSGTGGDSGSHLLARMGADTFLILVEGVAGEEDALRLAERIDDALRGDFTCGGRKVRVATTTGIALADAGYDRAEQVLRDAELALRRAKAHGRGSALLFAPDMREETTSRLDIEHELDQAVSREQLRLDYQPIVNLGSGEVVGFEALLRWDHPRLGRVSPGRFIPVAEETGLIVPLGRWVLEEACAQLGRWLRMGMKQLPGMSINLSRRQLTRPGLVEQVAHCLEANDLPPGLVHLEITESALMEDAPAGAAALEGLRQLGVRLSMDDFGTGYSSLACLHRFPLDVLKIDRSFVSNMGLRRDYTAVVQAIVSLAHNLGMAVIAEGIETPDQVLQLQALDADLGQGYHFGRPMNAGAAEQLLRLGRVHRQSA